ncbi:Saccharopine dehydrogenase [Tepidanaerobacter acetatoxydans Re1]|uniref:Saccharopine dehydrogenase n=1 Tax=Tepidanaerobacter acetatoxydans (strain DSM 21804 / JCM 16047 / Re1) TaxID=1209989 RepID=F4LQY2_TEPAE|nr:saccharopine dehydrogenase C-terminal domain-containing protein [Tepidanaerobacter acetatoxydans]AEE92135.1 Saccharopine dehydrogenase [Tepidanaerobacter acetatoxydans Re1]CCP26989.1 Saccharopine dehydrogenase [Tepidanaerobacter acetatoxydans Re1]
MKITVLGGAGDMGSRAVRDLAKSEEVTELVIADINIAAAKKLADALGEKVKAVYIDANRPETLISAMQGKDVVASAMGPFYKFEKVAVEAAIASNVHYVSICDDYDAAESILTLDEKAKNANLSILTGLGWTPGISNILARKGADELDEVEEINIYWAGSASDATGLAVTLHTIHIFTGKVTSFIDGKKIEIPAGSGKEKVEFLEPLDFVDMYHLGHPEPVTLPLYLEGVKTVTLKGGLKESYLNKLAIVISRLGLTNTPSKKQFVGNVIKTVLPILEKIQKPAVPLSGIRVDVKGYLNGKRQHLVYQAVDHMSNLTGVPLAIGAMMMARGEITRKGVFAPEAAVNPDRFIKELAERNIKVVQTKGVS